MDRYGGAIETSFRIAMRRVRLRSIFIALITLVSFSALAAIVWFGGNEVLQGRLTPGQLFRSPFTFSLPPGQSVRFPACMPSSRSRAGPLAGFSSFLNTPNDIVEARMRSSASPGRGEIESVM